MCTFFGYRCHHYGHGNHGPFIGEFFLGQVVKERLVEHRQKEKASYGGLFEKGPMYSDKEVRAKSG